MKQGTEQNNRRSYSSLLSVWKMSSRVYADAIRVPTGVHAPAYYGISVIIIALAAWLSVQVSQSEGTCFDNAG